MAEVLGVVSAVNQLLETAIRLINRLRKAYERQKDLAGVLDSHLQELSSIRTITKIIEDETALQTANVSATLERLKSTENTMIAWLRSVDPGKKGSIQQFSHQLVHGSKDLRNLADIMNDLLRVKADLCMNIHVAHVGVTRTVGNIVVANSEVIHRIDQRLIQIFGPQGGLRIARLLKDRSPEDDGSVHLSDDEIASLSSQEDFYVDGVEPKINAFAKSVVATKRVIRHNATKDAAFMISGAVGEDLWKKINHLEITNNTAEGDSMMVNHAISLDVFDRLLSARAGTRGKNTTM
ncbi:MAG: hypothetical protein M1821_003273 [Bathelium mastoideum]|nr:MAG: hypothetical protein M1821_003273 [Bathelium mastoideum]